MVTKVDTLNVASSLEIPSEDTAESSNWGYWGLALGLVLITLGLLYGSYFFLLS